MIVQPIRNIDDLFKLQEALKADKKYRELLLTQLLYNTNLRVSDALTFKWQHFFEDGKVVEYFYVKEQKTHKNKPMPIVEDLAKAITVTYNRLGKPPLNQFMFLSGSSRVKRFKRPWTRGYVTSFLKLYARKVGLTENIGAHSLRKTWAYQSYKSGQDIHLISKILNHSSELVTEIYVGIRQDTIFKEYERVSKLHSKSKLLFEE